MGSTDWPWVDGCARCAGLAADPQPGLFTWQEMAGRHFEQDHPPIVSGVPPIYGPPQRGTRIIDPLTPQARVAELRSEIEAAVKDYRTVWPEPHALSPNLSLAVRALALLPPRATCGKKVGTRPWWMGVDQYDPCRCLLDPGHDGECVCEHTRAARTEAGEGR